MYARFVLDSSVVIAAADPTEVSHPDAACFLERLARAQATAKSGDGEMSVLAPPELWLEVEVALRRKAIATRPHAALAITFVPLETEEAITNFLDAVEKGARGKRISANATDLAYLWVAWREDAALVTLDGGLLKYHGVVCDVTRPQHVRFP